MARAAGSWVSWALRAIPSTLFPNSGSPLSPTDVAAVLQAHSHEGRGSCDADWAFLGAMAAALQLPPEAARELVRQAEHSDPNGVFKVVWFEAGA